MDEDDGGTAQKRRLLGSSAQKSGDCRCKKPVKTLTQKYDWLEIKKKKQNKTKKHTFYTCKAAFHLLNKHPAAHPTEGHTVGCVKWGGNAGVLKYYTSEPEPNENSNSRIRSTGSTVVKKVWQSEDSPRKLLQWPWLRPGTPFSAGEGWWCHYPQCFYRSCTIRRGRASSK